ncbi:hypothetical protein [Burkholderia stagnalis]
MVAPVQSRRTSSVNGMSSESPQADRAPSPRAPSNRPASSAVLRGLPRLESQDSDTESTMSGFSGSFDPLDMLGGAAHPPRIEDTVSRLPTPQRTGAAPPSPQALLENARMSAAMRTAFDISRRTGKEQGGIISHNPDTNALHVEFRTSGQSHAVDMNRPHLPHGFRVIANYHTHPNREESAELAHANLPPSRADLSNAEARGTPGIVITYPNAEQQRGRAPLARDNIEMATPNTAQGSAFIYGPLERRTPAASSGYPDRAPLARPEPAVVDDQRPDLYEVTDSVTTELRNFNLAPNATPPADAPRFNSRGRSNSTSDAFTTPTASLDTGGPQRRRADSLPSGNV